MERTEQWREPPDELSQRPCHRWPERPEFIREFRAGLPGYMLRHKVKGGLTGWAQVNGCRGNTSIEKRLEFDMAYLRHWSLTLDLRIILLTLWRGFNDPNAY
jgi:lipopolysaccharide/colanic/teichoic acid biosynthesis glycosyltransferase